MKSKPCPHCGKQHRPETRTCPATGNLVDAGQVSAKASKTIFGMAAPPPLPMPVRFGKPAAVAPVAKPGEVARKTNPPLAARPAAVAPVSAGTAPVRPPAPALPSVLARAPAPAAPSPPSAPPEPKKPAFAKTLFMSGPPPSSRAAPSSVAAPAPRSTPAAAPAAPSVPRPASPVVNASSASPPAPPAISAAPASVPTGATPVAASAPEVASEIPLVVDLSGVEPAGQASPTPPSPSPDSQQATLTMERPGKESRTIPLREEPVMPAPPVAPARVPAAPKLPASQPDLATVKFDLGDLTPVDAAPVALLIASRQQSDKHDAPPPVAEEEHESPAQLTAPKPRTEPSAKRGGVALRRASWLMRALADGQSAMRVLADSAKFYGKNVRAFALLMAVMLLPMVATKSCLVAASTGSVGAISTTVDLSRVREDLTRRAQASEAQGQVDKAALAELAALESVAAAHARQPSVEEPSDFVRTARWVGAALLTGIFLFGLAIPLGFAAVAMLFIEHTTMARWPGVFEILDRLWRRRLPLAASLLPAALIVTLGCALLLVPGLLAAVLFLFVPAVVIFEHASGKAALGRSLGLVRADGVRVVVVMLAAFVAGAAAYLLAGVLMPEGTLRIQVFLRLLLGDGLMLAFFPVPALAVARLYIELRARQGETAEALLHAGRREIPAGSTHAGRR